MAKNIEKTTEITEHTERGIFTKMPSKVNRETLSVLERIIELFFCRR